MEEGWLEAFYRETDANKRLELLKEHEDEGDPSDNEFRRKIWIARYGKRRPSKDTFVGALMELKYLAEGSGLDPGGKKKRQGAKILLDLGLAHAEELEDEKREILEAELMNVFLRFIEVSRQGRGFTSMVFGMGQLSSEGIAKKIADQISVIVYEAPRLLHMDKEYALLREAALKAYRKEYPNREHFLRKM